MKSINIPPLACGLLMLALLVSMSTSPRLAMAQDETQTNQVYPETSEKFSREELAQMLAPIALYPDSLLAQILMASTYPIEVIEADRWAKKNPDLKDEALDKALLDKDWDPSVKALCHFPSILALMSERISETTKLGNAFLAQEAEVMDMIQELRAQARAEGHLASDSQQNVIVEQDIIFIEPADPMVYYVPYYDPLYIYGVWPYPSYLPYYWGPPGIQIGIGIFYWPRIRFSFIVVSWSYFDWHHHHIYIHVHRRPRFVRPDHWIVRPGPWHHVPIHRRGVAYRDKATARKYGQSPPRTRTWTRDTRGFPVPRDWDRDRAQRERTEREKAERERASRSRQEQQRFEAERQRKERELRDSAERERAARAEQEKQRIQRELQLRERAERDRRIQQQADQERRARERIKPDTAAPRAQTPYRSHDDIFNRVDEGKSERRSSERGQASRQGLGRQDSTERSGRFDPGRSRQ